MSRLIDAGLEPNGVDEQHGTALITAIATVKTDVVNALLENNKVNIKLHGGPYGTALQAAAYRGDEETGGKGENVIEAACISGVDAIIQGIFAKIDVSAPCNIHGSILQAVPCIGNRSAVEKLLQEGAKVNWSSGIYGTALQAAAKRSNHERTLTLDHAHKHLHNSVIPKEGNYRDIVRLLIFGASPLERGGYYGSILKTAISSKSNEMIYLILDAIFQAKGRQLYPYDEVLAYAIIKLDNPKSVVEELITNGANVNHEANEDSFHRPLDTASFYGHASTVELLIDMGTKIDVESGKYGNRPRAAIAANK